MRRYYIEHTDKDQSVKVVAYEIEDTPPEPGPSNPLQRGIEIPSISVVIIVIFSIFLLVGIFEAIAR
mgnify:CR=1 FL=1